MKAARTIERSGRGCFAVMLAVATASCALPPRMCNAETDCAGQGSCVAGRCLPHGATPAIATARRLLFSPVDVGWVRRGESGDERGADVATVGRGDGAIILLRFSMPLGEEAKILEAYLLLERAPGLDADPVPMTLHAARIVGPWDGASLSWARQPPVAEVGAPITRVTPASGPLVRVDVRAIVERWRRRARDEFGVAVVTEGQSATGMAFALRAVDVPGDRGDPVLSPSLAMSTQAAGTAGAAEPRPEAMEEVGDARRQVEGPRLEVYVR